MRDWTRLLTRIVLDARVAERARRPSANNAVDEVTGVDDADADSTDTDDAVGDDVTLPVLSDSTSASLGAEFDIQTNDSGYRRPRRPLLTQEEKRVQYHALGCRARLYIKTRRTASPATSSMLSSVES